MAINQIGLSADQLAFDAKEIGKLQQGAKSNTPEAIKASAKQFEALFMNMIMKSMRDATPPDGLMDNNETKTYTAMMDQKVSENLAKRGVGLADVLFRQLSVVTSTPASGAQNESTLDPSMRKPVTPLNNSFEGGLPALTVPVRKSFPAQPAHVKAFQDKFGAEAEIASRATGIPAKFMLGQAALETGWGKKEIIATNGMTSHNLFGIKAGSGWQGKVVEARTTEYVNGVAHSRIEKFRAYDSYADAFKDYGRLITHNPRYKNVMENVTDATGFAQSLQRAGYATDPQYAAKVASIIKNSLLA
jgi:flagellar protein FlgJ